MLENFSKLKVKKNDREYALHCAPDSPLGELHDVISEMKAYIIKRITDLHEAEKPPAPSNPDESPPQVID